MLNQKNDSTAAINTKAANLLCKQLLEGYDLNKGGSAADITI